MTQLVVNGCNSIDTGIVVPFWDVLVDSRTSNDRNAYHSQAHIHNVTLLSIAIVCKYQCLLIDCLALFDSHSVPWVLQKNTRKTWEDGERRYQNQK